MKHIINSKKLAARSAGLNSESRVGTIPLDWVKICKEKGYVEITNAIDCGEDLNLTDEGGNGVLHLVVGNKNLDSESRIKIIRMLFVSGVDIDHKNRMGQTPLHCAFINSDPELVLALISLNADLDAEDNEGKTPFMSMVHQYDPAANWSSSIADCVETLYVFRFLHALQADSSNCALQMMALFEKSLPHKENNALRLKITPLSEFSTPKVAAFIYAKMLFGILQEYERLPKPLNIKFSDYFGAQSIIYSEGPGIFDMKGMPVKVAYYADYITSGQKLIRERAEMDAASRFARVVYTADGFLTVKSEQACQEASSFDDEIDALLKSRRFMLISQRLPMELQMIVCKRASGLPTDGIKAQHSEPQFVKQGKALRRMKP